MARSESIKKDYISDVAFLLAKQEGFENVTARKLAAKAGCSTQPIFRLYQNMEDLWTDVYNKCVDYYEVYYRRCLKNHAEPFVDLGMAYIGFAQKEKHLFKLLFMSESASYSKSLYDILNGKEGSVGKEFAKAKEAGVGNAQDLFTKMWIFIHGIACMSISGDYDLNEAQTQALLVDTYIRFR